MPEVKITGLDPEAVVVTVLGADVPFIIRGAGLNKPDLIAYLVDDKGEPDELAPAEKAGVVTPNEFPVAVRAKLGTKIGARKIAVGLKGAKALATREGIIVA